MRKSYLLLQKNGESLSQASQSTHREEFRSDVAPSERSNRLVHQYSLRKLDLQNTNYLSGYISYVNGVEPDFVRSLERKYGEALITLLRNGPNRRTLSL